MILDKCKIIFVHIPRTGGTSIEKFFNQELHNHFTALEIIKRIGQEKWDEYFKFSIVRNPWDRLVSCYRRRIENDELCSSVLFEDWLFEVKDQWWVVQSNWLNYDFDYIGRFENLSSAYDLICNKCNVENKIGHFNKTSRFNYFFYHTKKTVPLVEKICKEDIFKYRYKYKYNYKYLL